MCGCFVVLLGAMAPRLTLFLMAVFNDEITKAFDGSWLVPLLGWFVLPYSTLSYVLFHWFSGDVMGFDWLVVGFAFVLDVGSWVGGWGRRSEVRQVTVYRSPPAA